MSKTLQEIFDFVLGEKPSTPQEVRAKREECWKLLLEEEAQMDAKHPGLNESILGFLVTMGPNSREFSNPKFRKVLLRYAKIGLSHVVWALNHADETAPGVPVPEAAAQDKPVVRRFAHKTGFAPWVSHVEFDGDEWCWVHKDGTHGDIGRPMKEIENDIVTGLWVELPPGEDPLAPKSVADEYDPLAHIAKVRSEIPEGVRDGIWFVMEVYDQGNPQSKIRSLSDLDTHAFCASLILDEMARLKKSAPEPASAG
jgi:hypothetical protein